MALQSFVGPWPLLQFRNLFFTQTVGLLGRVISPSQGRYLHTEQHKQNKHTQTSMLRVGFEPTIQAFERAKTVHTLDRAATVIGDQILLGSSNEGG
jgi:FAD synthase